MPGGHHSQFLQPNWRPAQLAAKILTTMPRQKKTKAQAFAGQPVRLPKPALLEFAQQLERCEDFERPSDTTVIIKPLAIKYRSPAENEVCLQTSEPAVQGGSGAIAGLLSP